MIEQTAIVTEVFADTAKVRVYRESACGKCQSQKSCGTQVLSKVLGNKFSEICVLNSIDAKVGDTVKVGLSEGVLLKSAFMVYMFPLLMLFIGALIVSLLSAQPETGQVYVIFGGLAGFGLAVYWIRLLMKRRAQDPQYQPVIISRVPVPLNLLDNNNLVR